MVERLRIGIYRHKLHAHRLHFDHPLYGIAATAADSNDANRGTRNDIGEHFLVRELRIIVAATPFAGLTG